MTEVHPFKWRHFQPDIILLCVRWYLRYALSYRDVEAMMQERGLHIDHSTIFRWVQHYAPELEKRCRPQLKECNDSWKGDQTYIMIKKVWFSLYRAVDSTGDTIEFILSPPRDSEAAKRFFRKALASTARSVSQACPVAEQVAQPRDLTGTTPVTSVPRVINVDKNAAYPKAITELKAAGVLPQHMELRQKKYLNNLIEQDHRFIKRITFTDDTNVVLDVIWISQERLRTALQADRKLHASPELVVEVLSPGSENERRDREVKLKLYSRRNAKEYWIVNWRERTIEVYRRQDAVLELDKTLDETDTLESPLLTGFRCKVSELFTNL